MSYINNIHDPHNLGVAINSIGYSSVSDSSFISSSELRKDPAKRRKIIAKFIDFLKGHRTRNENNNTLPSVSNVSSSSTIASYSFDELLRELKFHQIDQETRNFIYKDIQGNEKIQVIDSDHIAYKPIHNNINNMNDLKLFLSKYTHGICEDEFDDAYDGVKEDLKILLNQQFIYSIAYLEKKKTYLFPRYHPTLSSSQSTLHVDNDLKSLWEQVKMPRTQSELEEKLYKAGHLSEAQYRAGHLEKSRLLHESIKFATGLKAKELQNLKRMKRKRYPQKLTNLHLVGQFDWLQENQQTTQNNQKNYSTNNKTTISGVTGAITIGK